LVPINLKERSICRDLNIGGFIILTFELKTEASKCGCGSSNWDRGG
jgi:hypothetical protein